MEKYVGDENKEHVHSTRFPIDFRALIVGTSGCGKTCLLMRLLLEDNLLNYDKLYVFARTLYQPQYQILRAGMENGLPKEDIIKLLNSQQIIKCHETRIEEIAKALRIDNEENDITPSSIEAEFYDTNNKIPDPSELDRSQRTLFVFDDIMTDRSQKTPEDYYTRSRSANCDCIYLSQNYTHLPLHTIRSNSNFMIFFKSPQQVVEQIHRSFSSVDMDYQTFKQLCKTFWNNKYSYLVIDLSRDYESGLKYRNYI